MQDLESREKREERWWMTYGLAYRERERGVSGEIKLIFY